MASTGLIHFRFPSSIKHRRSSLALLWTVNLLVAQTITLAYASTTPKPSSTGSGSGSTLGSGSSGSGTSSSSSSSSSSGTSGSMALTNPYPIRTLIGNIYFRLLQHRKPIMIVPPILRLMYQYRRPLITALTSFSSVFGLGGLGGLKTNGFEAKGAQDELLDTASSNAIGRGPLAGINRPIVDDYTYNGQQDGSQQSPSHLFNQLLFGGAGGAGGGGVPAPAPFGFGRATFGRFPGAVGMNGFEQDARFHYPVY